jgi:hypothetical protein
VAGLLMRRARGVGVLVRAVLVGAVLLLPGCTREEGIPSVLEGTARDCSEPVDADLRRFIASAKPGTTLTFPEDGCFLHERTILVADARDITIDGNGSRFKKSTPSDKATPNNASWRVAGGRGVTLQNMVIEGSFRPVKRGTPGPGGFTDHGVSIWGGRDVMVRGMTITNVDGECATADPDIRKGSDYRIIPPSRDVTIDRLTCRHAARQGVAATSVEGFTLSNSTLEDIQQNGVDIEIDVQGELARRIRIVDNVFNGIYFAAIAVPLGNGPDVGDIVIDGNRMRRASDTCMPAIYLGDHGYRMGAVTVTDNRLLTLSDGVQMIGVARGTVTGNVIIKTATAGNACDNPNRTPPQGVPVRQIGSTATVDRNRVAGFSG